MNITLGITTFNRAAYLKKSLASLNASVDTNRLNIRIYDDQSTEFTVADLWQWVPQAASIIVHPKKLYADGNMRALYDFFLAGADDILINADSDLIYRPGWLDFLLGNLANSDGILSLYNSDQHPFRYMCSPELGVKQDLGAAGTVFARPIVAMIMNELKNETAVSFDWKWSALLAQQGIRLLCSHDSYVQHIGYQGQNNHGNLASFDFGRHFHPGNQINAEIMMDLLYEIKASVTRPDSMNKA